MLVMLTLGAGFVDATAMPIASAAHTPAAPCSATTPESSWPAMRCTSHQQRWSTSEEDG
jgi:hypothetical protein